MADKELGSLTGASTPLDGDELHYVVQGGNSRKVPGSEVVKIAHTQPFLSITGTPTTREGYGITDAASSGQGALADTALQPGDIGDTVQAQGASLDSLRGITLEAGDVLYATGADTLARLPKGLDGEVLKLDAGLPAWGTAAGAGDMLVSVYDPDGKGNQVLTISDIGADIDTVAAGDDIRIGFTRSDLIARSIPAPIIAIRTTGYADAGDGGSALYKRVGTEPSHPGKVQSADAAWWEIVFTGEIDIRQFGAVIDGSTDCSPAIADADAVAAAFGGGIVRYPAGTTLVDYLASSLTQRYCIFPSSHVLHAGFGMGASVVRLKDAANAHVFLFRETEYSGVIDLKVDGNRDNQTADPLASNAPSAIMAATAAYYLRIERNHVVNAFDYAIGIEVGEAFGCKTEGNLIEDCGSDGVDIKNTLGTGRNNRLVGNLVRRFGLHGDATSEQFAGFDIRGQWFVSDNRVEQLGYGKISYGRIGFRIHSGGGGTGLPDPATQGGGTLTSIVNCHVEGDGDTYKTDVSVRGYHIMDPSVHVVNCHVERAGYGLVRNQRYCTLRNITISKCRRGFWEDSTQTAGGNPLPTMPIFGEASGITISDCTEFGARFEAGASLNGYQGLTLVGNAQNLSMALTCGGNTFVGGAIIDPKAMGYMELADQPSTSDTFTVNGTTVTFVSGTPVGNQVQIGANVGATVQALADFLSGSADANIALSTYIRSNLRVRMIAIVSGTAGAAYTLAKSGTNLAVSGATLVGGVNVSGGDGTNKFRDVRGYKTSGTFLSDEFALDATGTKTITITHDLAITPTPQQCRATLYVNNGADDFVISAIWVRSAGSTTVTIKLKVTTASATSGLKGQIALDIDTRP